MHADYPLFMGNQGLTSTGGSDGRKFHNFDTLGGVGVCLQGSLCEGLDDWILMFACMTFTTAFRRCNSTGFRVPHSRPRNDDAF